MHCKSFVFAGIGALLLTTVPVSAELPPLTAEKKKKEASHIVTGEVKTVYSTEKRKGKEEAVLGKDYINTNIVLEISVDAVEKGEGVKTGRVFYVRTWKAKKRPQGFVGASGQWEIPKEGEKVRVFLNQAPDGGHDLLLPNGIDRLKEAK